MQKKFPLLTILIFLWTTITVAFAQERTISGKVAGADGLGLPGASIALKGTVKGVVTDDDGKYAIGVPMTKAVLVFSFTGFMWCSKRIPNNWLSLW
jgi:TonB-dependent starch-binding outer membrane protein SusC